MNKPISNLAFVFPGQGSQAIGMLSELAASHSSVIQVFEQASAVLSLDLWKLIQEGPVKQLNKTENTQPALLAASFAVWTVWCQQTTIRPGWMAGHSLGEYTALVATGALDFEDAIRLVAQRGRLMQEAVPEGMGAMVAILGLKDEQVISLCADVANDEIVSAVNFNSPGQVVIAGNKAAVERAMVAATDAGAKKVLLLPVSTPSHCALMAFAAKKLEQYLQSIDIQAPTIPLLHNVDAASHNTAGIIRSILAKQLHKPVRWTESIKFIHEQGVQTFVECGPGKVLTGLDKRIAKGAQHLPLNNPKTLNTLLESLT